MGREIVKTIRFCFLFHISFRFSHRALSHIEEWLKSAIEDIEPIDFSTVVPYVSLLGYGRKRGL